MRKRALDFYSYDFVDNPWLGGGGAYRDLEVLSRLVPRFGSIRLHVGGYPGARRHIRRGVEVIPAGFGRNEIVSRLTYALAANLRLLRPARGGIGIALSPYSPLPAAMLHRGRMFGILHHVIGETWIRKLGPVGRAVAVIERLYYRMPRRVITVNDDVAEALRAWNPGAEVLRSANGYDPALLELPDASSSSAPFILFLGRLDPVMKGIDLLIEAFARVAKRFPDVGLVLAGRGDAREARVLLGLAREHGVEDRVTVRASVSDAEKKDLLARCLFFSSPSRYEGFGIAALEANAAGKAVAVSRASGFRNSIADGQSGVLVDVRAPGALESALADLLGDPEKRKRMGAQARDWARGFGWDAIAEREGAWLEAHGAP